LSNARESEIKVRRQLIVFIKARSVPVSALYTRIHRDSSKQRRKTKARPGIPIMATVAELETQLKEWADQVWTGRPMVLADKRVVANMRTA
jgi:hypothetical protein